MNKHKFNRMKRKVKRVVNAFVICFVMGLVIPQGLMVPVEGARNNDFNPKSFWHCEWGLL